ncbi:hypothetical protein [Dactylosporangium sp. NPDC049140]|uniref:hypothetical protein n=1 Tax=Dactylosporangium sp. NPDC049140 TaxID=3155647 RepID=UPI00340A3A58
MLRTTSAISSGSVALTLLAALEGGNLLSHTMRSSGPLRAAMNAALAYIGSFGTRAA